MAERSYTRHVATIVSIDAAGFSRLMGINDELAVAAFEARRAIILESCGAAGGRVFGVAGDSIMAEFGVPIDALRAGFDFQEKIAALNASVPESMHMPFRVGINTGNVIVRNDSLYGDDVNIAARIQELAPDGGLAISETTWHHVKERSPTRFSDIGEQTLKNIALPVRVFIAARDIKESGRAAVSRKRGAFPTVPPAIAILPFLNKTGDPDFDYMADGIAEDVIQGLSNTRWLPVIAKNSSFQFRDKSLGTRMIGSALGARYVVDGRLFRVDGQLALAVTLTDAVNERLLWSRGFRQTPAEIVSLHSEIAGVVVATLEKEVERVEQARTFQIPWESLETWQLIRRGRWHMQRRTRADTALALKCFENAQAKEPNSSAVLNELAWWYFWRAWLRSGESEGLDKVVDYSRRSLLMDSQDARPHAHLAAVAIMRGQPGAALEHLREALEINPSFAFAHSGMGSAHLLLAEAEAAIPCFLTAARLSPFDTYGFHNFAELAAAYCFTSQWDDAITTANHSLNLSPRYFYARFLKIGSLARSGRTEEARQELRIFKKLHPNFSKERIDWIPFTKKSASAFLMENFENASDTG